MRSLLEYHDLEDKKNKRILYHIGQRPAQPKPGRKGDSRRGDKSAVYMSSNPEAIFWFHGVTGNVYAYRVPEWVIQKSGGMKRYDTGTEILIYKDVWDEAGDEIEFLGKSMSEDELQQRTDTHPTRFSRASGTRPGWMDSREWESWSESSSSRKHVYGLRATKHPENAIKMMTPDERIAVLSAFERVWKEEIGTRWGPGQRDREIIDLLKKYMTESILRDIILFEMRSLIDTEHKLPDFLYGELDDVIKNSNFWKYENTEDDIDMASTSGEWHSQTHAAGILEKIIENYLKSNGVTIDVIVVSAEVEDNPKLDLPVGPGHRLYPNRIVVGGQQSVSEKGKFIMYLFMLPVSENFESNDVSPDVVSKFVGNTIRHEIIHASQMEQRRKRQNISRYKAKERFESEGEIPKSEDRPKYLGSKMEIDSYGHELAEELLQKYGKDMALDILRGSIPTDDLDLSSQLREYLDNVPGDAAVMRLKKKIYSHIIDLTDRGIYSESKKKKKKSRKRSRPQDGYEKGTDKNLYLDKPSTHGGWPEGEYKPSIMKQISTWMKDMDMLKNEWNSLVSKSRILEQKGYFGQEFEEFKSRFESGENPLEVVADAGWEQIGAGSTRTIFAIPGNEFVLKVANPVESRGFEMIHAVDSNKAEANNLMNTKYPLIFPKVYERAPGYEWIVQEKVRPITDRFDIEDYFSIYGLNLQRSHLPFSLALDLAATEIRGGDVDNFVQGEMGASLGNFSSSFASTYRNLKKDRTFNDLASAIAEFNIAPTEIRPGNVGFVKRDGRDQFVLLDASIFDREIL